MHGAPQKFTIDKSGSNTHAIARIQADSRLPITLRQSTCLNTVIEQVLRAMNRITRPMSAVKCCSSARALVAGIDLKHMVRKGQLAVFKDRASSAAEHFDRLART